MNRAPNRQVSPHVPLDELIERAIRQLPPVDTRYDNPDVLIDPEFDEEGDYHVAQY